ncbi:transposase, partial [Streptomyces javensis]|nr:transposase [Streptomyces javensis]
MSLHAVTDAASIPVTWRLFLPAEWADPFDGRRSKAGAPQDVGHREKWRLALDAIDEARGRGLDGRVVVADAGYGQIHSFPSGLAERGLDYVTAVRGDTSAHPGDAVPTAPEREGRMGTPRLPRYREPARSLKDLVMTAGRRRLRRITWRQGGTAWDGALPVETLIAERPPGQSEPTDNWLTSPPADTALRHLARMTKIRRRIKHDHRELKHSPGAGPLREPYLTRMTSPHHPPHRHPH